MKQKIQFFTIAFLVLNCLHIRAQQPPEFNAFEKAGIEKYDSEKVIKKLKITDETFKNKVTKHIQIYNQEMDNLLLIHGNTLENLEKEFDKNVKIAIQNRDRSQMNGVKAKIGNIIPPIRLEVQKHKDVLNEDMKVLLTEKQYKKWLRY